MANSSMYSTSFLLKFLTYLDGNMTSRLCDWVLPMVLASIYLA